MAKAEKLKRAEATPAQQARESRFFNRELSWLEFEARVLALAGSADLPLLERVKFMAFFGRMLDEFFQIRVAGLKEQVAAGVTKTSPDGLTAREQIDAISERVRALAARQNQLFTKKLRPALTAEGIQLVDWEELERDDHKHLRETFEQRVFPVLTPLAVDPAHPFPYISNLSLNLAVVVRDPTTRIRRFARVKVPQIIPRFVPMPDGRRFLPLEQLIAANASLLFPGMQIETNHPFRVTRDADVELEVAEADDLLAATEAIVRRRERSPEAVRLEVHSSMPPFVRTLLMEELNLTPPDVYVTRATLGLGDLWQLTELDRPELKYEAWTGITPPRLAPVEKTPPNFFEVLKEGDVLVQHPYDAFSSSIATFIDQAVRDPSVLTIKQTLYRTSVKDSSVVRSLVRAAESGKQAVALIELTARFDEETNIGWARVLEEAGVHVVYGVVGLKTHAKIALVVREEDDGIHRYCHVGTGNYHPGTAAIYEDIGLLTADPAIAADVADLFNSLTGYSRQEDYRAILVAPLTLRSRVRDMIREEAAAGKDGRIVMKMNSLVDPQMIDELYAASQAGTTIDLIVRGMCCLRPGVDGMSEKIRVRSIVGRFLEHSRILRFGSGSRVRFFIGSADLMQRNLDHRVECLAPVSDPALVERLEEILQVELADDVLAWELGPDGWTKVPTEIGLNAQVRLQELALARAGRDR